MMDKYEVNIVTSGYPDWIKPLWKDIKAKGEHYFYDIVKLTKNQISFYAIVRYAPVSNAIFTYHQEGVTWEDLNNFSRILYRQLYEKALQHRLNTVPF